MTNLKGDRLYVETSASEARRRLKGHGYGVRRVENAGRKRAAIVHTAVGLHLRQLESLFQDVLAPKPDPPPVTASDLRGVPND